MKRARADSDSTGIPTRVYPVAVEDLSGADAQAAFRALVASPERHPRSENFPRPWVEQVLEAVEKYPILAEVVHRTDGWSILDLLCSATNTIGEEYVLEAIKSVIRKNPYALVWGMDTDDDPLQYLTVNINHESVFSWITKEFSWIFQLDECKTYKPHIKLLRQIALDRFSRLDVLEEYYKVYPEGLFESFDPTGTRPIDFLLHQTIFTQQVYRLFQVMLDICPELLAYLDSFGRSLLYRACERLANNSYSGNLDQMYRLCMLLLERNPGLARVPSNSGRLPILVLSDKCHRTDVQNVMVALLRAMYPNVAPHYAEIPFIQRILHILKQEAQAALEVIDIKRVKTMMLSSSKAGPNQREADKAGTHYGEWADSRIIKLKEAIKVYRDRDIAFVMQTFEVDNAEAVVQQLASSSDDEQDGIESHGEDDHDSYIVDLSDSD